MAWYDHINHLSENEHLPFIFRVMNPLIDPDQHVPQLGENTMQIKYEYLRVIPNDRVRIKAQGIVAEGPVQSSYSRDVWNKPTTSAEANHKRIGYEPAGIEMTDDRSGGSPRYWKAEDGGIVEKLVGDKYIQVYPIHFEGFVS